MVVELCGGGGTPVPVGPGPDGQLPLQVWVTVVCVVGSGSPPGQSPLQPVGLGGLPGHPPGQLVCVWVWVTVVLLWGGIEEQRMPMGGIT